MLGSAFNALTSTSQGELGRRDRTALAAGPTASRNSHVNNFVIRREEVAEVIAWSPSFLRRLLGSDDHLGRVRVRMRNVKYHTLRFRDPESWRVASAGLANGFQVRGRPEVVKS